MTEEKLIQIFLSHFPNLDSEREVYANSYIADIVFRSQEIAIEAKLSDLNKAIVQACAYSMSYKNTFILMPFSKKPLLLSRKKVLLKNNIKWVFLKADGSLCWGHSSWKKLFLSKASTR